MSTSTMKAVVLRRYGSPTDLQLAEVAKPQPVEDEVLVKVHATAVNDWDWSFVRGKPYVYRLMFGLTAPKVTVLGAEVAGVVGAVGPHVTTFQPGDEVYGDISEAGLGGFAEYVCVRESALGRKPCGMSFEQAATLPHAAGLAVQGLIDVGEIQQGEKVLINGAGGGVGMLGVQIAKQFGAEVTGVDSGFKLDTLTDLGFDHVIDYRQQDFTRNGERYDLILDAKTTRSPFRLLRSLKPGGRYVTVGGDLRKLLQIFFLGSWIHRFTGKSLRVVGLKPNKDLDYVNDVFDQQGVTSVIDGPYSLADVPRAIERFGEAEHIGKIVITVSS